MGRIAVNEPYFLTNVGWYYFDEVKWKFVLTDKATEKAKQSYFEFYNKNNEDFKENDL